MRSPYSSSLACCCTTAESCGGDGLVTRLWGIVILAAVQKVGWKRDGDRGAVGVNIVLDSLVLQSYFYFLAGRSPPSRNTSFNSSANIQHVVNSYPTLCQWMMCVTLVYVRRRQRVGKRCGALYQDRCKSLK